MNEQPKSRLNAADPSPYILLAVLAAVIAVVVGGGLYIAAG